MAADLYEQLESGKTLVDRPKSGFNFENCRR